MNYVVYLTMYSGTILPRWYIGSTNITKIAAGYNGSVCSKKWKTKYKHEQKINKHFFTTRILSFHKTRKEALAEELRLHIKHNVVKNIKYMNESRASVDGMFGRDVSGENHPLYGTTMSEVTKQKVRQTKEQRNSDIIGGKKCSETKNSDEWKEAVGREAVLKSNITKKQRNSDIIGGKKCSETKNSDEWKETVGREAKRKELETKQTTEYKEKLKLILPGRNKSHKDTINSKEWKEAHSGVNHHHCKYYIIYDTNKDIYYEGVNNVSSLSVMLDISHNLIRSAIASGEPLFSRTKKSVLEKMKLNGKKQTIDKYKGFTISIRDEK